MQTTRRTFLTGLSAFALAPALAACGDDAGSTPGAQPSAGNAAEEGALPVTIKHKFGSTTITKAPERIVCVGLVEQDALLALGLVPVAVTKWFGEAAGQIFPWATAALGKSPLPTVLEDKDGVQFEKVAGLKPDLIIGQYAGLKQKDYDLLSKIAPTVAQPAGYVDFGVPWQESTRTIGQAVGRPAATKKLLDDVNAKIAKAAADHPEFAKASAIVATTYEGIFVYGPEDPRSRLMKDLGFAFPPALTKVGGDEFGASISPEKVGLLDVDCVVWINDEPATTKATGGLWAKTKAAKEGRGAFIAETDGAFYVAHSMLTPLSIPYMLERYVPMLAAAVDGDPSTKVPKAVA